MNLNKEPDEKLNFGVVAELLKGPEWKSVEEIVKFTFKALNEVIISQAFALKDLERGLASKVSKADFFAETGKKVENSCFLDQLNDCRQEFRALFNEIDSKFYEKASVEDLQKIAQEKVGKEQVDYLISSVKQETFGQNSVLFDKIESFQASLASVESGLLSLKIESKQKASQLQVEDQLARLKDQLGVLDREGSERLSKALEAKADIEQFHRSQEIMKGVQEGLKKIESVVEDLRRGHEELGKAKAGHTELFKFVDMTNIRLDSLHQTSTKTSFALEGLEGRLAGIEKSLFHQFSEYQQIQEFVRRSTEKASLVVENMQTTQELHNSAINQVKLDLEELNHSKASLQSLSLKADFDLVASELSKKLDESSFFSHLHDIKRQMSALSSSFSESFHSKVEVLENQLNEKAGFKEICGILDQKAGIHDINLALGQIHDEIDLKQLQLESYKEKQEAFLNSWCMDRVIGRWRATAGSAQRGVVVWDRQVLQNDNFVWEAAASCVLAVKGGIFELTLAVFSAKRPNVQVLVNGEVALSAVQSQFNVAGNTGKLKNVRISGVSAKETLNLPNRARVSVAVNVDDAECFLDLRKMS